MKIVFLGDSITDAGRYREWDDNIASYGNGYVRTIAGELLTDNPGKYEIINRGISGNRSVDCYARIKGDVWNLKPDVVNLFFGVNDTWVELINGNGVSIDRFEKMYRMIIEETRKALPNVKLIMCEPYVLKGVETKDKWEEFLKVKEYAKVAKKLATEYDIPFVELQESLEKASPLYPEKLCIADGVHPQIVGATLIGRAWIKVFKEKIEK